jgi:hypothetical protein
MIPAQRHPPSYSLFDIAVKVIQGHGDRL